MAKDKLEKIRGYYEVLENFGVTDLTRKSGIAVYKSFVIDIDEFIGMTDEDDRAWYGDGDDNTVEIDVDTLPKHSTLLNMYRDAREAINPAVAFLNYYKMIEYVAPAVAKKTTFDEFIVHLALPASTPRDYLYMDELLRIAKGYRDNQKDDFLANSVVQTCLDVVPEFHHLPDVFQKSIKHNLGVAENTDITTIALTSEQQASLKKQVANILYSTRNSVVHAKSNYVPNGLECPIESLDEVNQMMAVFAKVLVQWNDNQTEYIRV